MNKVLTRTVAQTGTFVAQGLARGFFSRKLGGTIKVADQSLSWLALLILLCLLNRFVFGMIFACPLGKAGFPVVLKPKGVR